MGFNTGGSGGGGGGGGGPLEKVYDDVFAIDANGGGLQPTTVTDEAAILVPSVGIDTSGGKEFSGNVAVYHTTNKANGIGYRLQWIDSTAKWYIDLSNDESNNLDIRVVLYQVV
jgi:hypothetical protein